MAEATGSDTVTVGVPQETFPGERRIALVPAGVAALKKAGLEVIIQQGAGASAGFPDSEYEEAGAGLVSDRTKVFETADIVLQVRTGGANLDHWQADLDQLREGQTLIGMCDPLGQSQLMTAVAERGVTCFSLELIPRITRAQSMDVLSSMATVAGYKAVLIAAETLPRMFPMMMTAAGTIAPAKVLVVGAGVAGLQAIASARKLGAVVQAYDIRPAVKEEVQSLGAKFVELELEASDSEQSGGYAKAMDEEFYRKQRELMTKVIADSDVVITTAAVPGKKAPVLVTEEMVQGMPDGSVVVDLAAEQGGNCELTAPGEAKAVGGVTIVGCVNLPTTIPYHASQMYSKNITTFLLHLVEEGKLSLDRDDEIIQGTMVTGGGEIRQALVRKILGLDPDEPPPPEPAEEETKEAGTATIPLAGDSDDDSGSEAAAADSGETENNDASEQAETDTNDQKSEG